MLLALVRLKFELTNQDSNDGAGVNVCQQEMHCNRFSLETELNIHEMEFIIPKTKL